LQWKALQIQERSHAMKTYVIRRPSAWADLRELEVAGAKSARIGNDEMPDRVRWIRSYVVHEPDGRIGTFCVYQARDGQSIREHARRVGMPGEEFYAVATTVVVRDDPVEANNAVE
jgi:Nickel responsive protein SCO4226-like